MVNPSQRAYQIQTLWESTCRGCRNCAHVLMDHPDAIRLDCHLCGSSYEPDRPWINLRDAHTR
jgi:hypothetical protein